ncbi:fatty acid binding protein 4b isoform X1 [Takifugu flavidus]|uniref:fatty acid binding protein 4b isoform X1 n=1 Tax=Takifugu flavidus TaxID=433684 RepID=UPI0025447966|nr:fatty acid binding protein 4b isoform X1 [Takifugu flavidus]
MVEQFVGNWTLVSSDNFDDYMKTIGKFIRARCRCGIGLIDRRFYVLGVNFATRQMGNMVKPNLVFSMGDDGFISMKSESTFKTTEIKFKLTEEFEETTADGRNTKTVVTFENGKLVQYQKWDGKETTIEREIQDGKLTAKCIADDVVALRTYERV